VRRYSAAFFFSLFVAARNKNANGKDDRVHEAAFPTPAEAQFVDALRTSGHLSLSLVCERDGAVVGHVAFSPVTVDHQPHVANVPHELIE